MDASLARTIGKIPVVVGVCDGFVGNRMLGRRHRETEGLLMTGALPEQVDRVLTGFGFPMGPCAMADLAGIDVACAYAKRAEHPWPLPMDSTRRAATARRTGACTVPRFARSWFAT